MVGVWIAPVIAQVMMTLSVAAMAFLSSPLFLSTDIARRSPLVRRERH